MYTPPILLLAAILLSGSMASAQDPLPAKTLPWPAGQVLHDTDASGALWASAETWKARFDRDGASFFVAVGEVGSAPSATFRLVAATLGGTKLAVGDAMPSRTAHRVTFERGAVREFFDLRAEGLEQQFAFTALPERAELVLDIAVDTTLSAEPEGAGLAFHGAHGGITYGQAFAIDALGARLPLTTVWRDGALRITVPAEFVASATLPLLVDPMIGAATSAWSSGTMALTGTDIAFDASLSRYYVTFERAFSATDHDVYVRYLDAAMVVQGLLAIDTTTDYWTKPKIATLEAHDVACVVAEHSGSGGPISVATRRILGLVVQAPWLLTPPSGAGYRDPAIGGDASPTGPSRFLLAWERSSTAVNDTEIWIGLLSPDNGWSASTFIGTGIGFDRRVRISKTCGPVGSANARWALLYRHESYQQTTGSLRVSMVRRDGVWYTSTPLTGVTPNAGSEWAISSPAAHAAGSVFLAVETRVSAGRGTILGHAFTGHGSVTLLAGDVPLTSGNYDRREPVVDSDGTRFAVGYSTRLTATDADLRVLTFAFVGGQLVQHDSVAPSFSLDYDGIPAICAARGFTANTYGLAWTRVTSGSHSLLAQRYQGVGAGHLAVRATGCGPITISTLGTPALGVTFTASLQTAAPLAGFFLGAPVSMPIGACPGCTQGANGVVLYGTTLPIAVPGNVNLVGIDLAVQGFAIDFAGLPCLGQIALSDTVDFRVR